MNQMVWIPRKALTVFLGIFFSGFAVHAVAPSCESAFQPETMSIPLLRYGGQTGDQFVSNLNLKAGQNLTLNRDLRIDKGEISSRVLNISGDKKSFSIKIYRLDEIASSVDLKLFEMSKLKYEGTMVGYATKPSKEVSLYYFGSVLLLFSKDDVMYKMSVMSFSPDQRASFLTTEKMNEALDLLFN